MSNKQYTSRKKENFRLGASTLINNDACIEMGRTRPWYGAVISAVLAIVIAVLPLMVSQFKTTGGQLLDSPTYSLDDGLITFQNELNVKNVSMYIDSNTDEMTVTNWNSIVNNTADQSYKDANSFLEVFYTPTIDDDFQTYVTTMTQDINHSYLVFGKKSFVISKYQNSTSSTSLLGKYDGLKSSFDLKDFVSKTSRGNAYSVTKADADQNVQLFDTYYNNSVNAWKEFLTDAYHSTKTKNAWRWTGIMCAVFASFVFFMGLMLFLMTRGKNNPYKTYTFWETQKIAYWASFSPAVIGMLLGFLFSSMAMMGFILAYGMRVMWLSSKSLRPM